MIMKTNVTEEIKYYNANVNDKSTGDCVIRSLSLAYNIDYRSVRSELHKIRRDNNFYQWNIKQNYEIFIKNHGYKEYKDIASENLTEEQFAANNQDGTYLLVVGKSKDSNNHSHMVCIIDGDIYDSWNSTGWYVKYYYTVTGDRADISEDSSETMQELGKYAVSFYEKVFIEYENKFAEYAKLDNTTLDIDRDPGVGQYGIYISAMYKYRFHNRNHYEDCDLKYKFTPRSTTDEKRNIINKMTVNFIKHFFKNQQKYIDEIIDAEQFDEYGPAERSFFGKERDLLIKLPLWCHKLVTYIDVDSRSNRDRSYWGGSKYQVVMKALKDDPRAEEAPSVYFYADSLGELIRDINGYRKNYSRFNYDY